MHGVREVLVEQQAQALGLPCHKVWLPTSPCSNAVYEAEMAKTLLALKADGVSHIIFGDLFLADIRAYRRKQMAALGLEAVFPLWLEDTKTLGHKIADAGMRALITCIDGKKLGKEFAGRVYDRDFIADLPPEIDPCGENGEFHSFVYQAPFFKRALDVVVGEIVERDGFIFADVLAR